MRAKEDRSGQEPRDRRARRACLLWAAVLTACGSTVLALVQSRWQPMLSADRSVATRLHAVAVDHPALTHTNKVLTDWVWDPTTMRLLALAATLFLLWRRSFRLAAWVVTTWVVALVVQNVMKSATGRARPHFAEPVATASGRAFPSGHAMTATITCGLLLMLVLMAVPAAGPRWRVTAWVLAGCSVIGVGFTRVFLGVHWMSDVLGGWLFGAAVLAATSALFAPWRSAVVRQSRHANGNGG